MLILMFLVAISVCGGGWIVCVLETVGVFNVVVTGDEIFIEIICLLTKLGLFGLIMVALMVALMFMVDTLINVMVAVTVNDVWWFYV